MDSRTQNTVLIVDDNPNNLKVLGTILSKNGFKLTIAQNGKDAIHSSQKRTLDIILLDILMPEMDGFEVCQHLKTNEKTKDIPIIFLSALTQSEDKVKAFKAGGLDYITKPFFEEEVIARVNIHVENNQLLKALSHSNRQLEKKQSLLDDDLKAAAEIQKCLLPKKNLSIKGIDIDWQFNPCSMIGGDIFNIVPLDNTTIAFYIIDVSGHGVPSAMVTVSVSQMLQENSGLIKNSNNEIVSPEKVLQALDDAYPIQRFDKYFTIFYGIMDVSTGKLTYSSAAHPPPIRICSTQKIDTLDKGGTIIGLGGMIPFEKGEIVLNKNDQIIFYTDGVTECRNDSSEFYGDQRLMRLVKSTTNMPVKETIQIIYDDLMHFSENTQPRDDISILGIKKLN